MGSGARKLRIIQGIDLFDDELIVEAIERTDEYGTVFYFYAMTTVGLLEELVDFWEEYKEEGSLAAILECDVVVEADNFDDGIDQLFELKEKRNEKDQNQEN